MVSETLNCPMGFKAQISTCATLLPCSIYYFVCNQHTVSLLNLLNTEWGLEDTAPDLRDLLVSGN